MPSRPIPLFPLHTVLFPRTPLSLRIFEERYLTMIRRCREQERPFGVVLIKEGREVGESATPHPVGTLARIREVSAVGNQLLVEVEGMERFRLLDYAADVEPYLVGTTEKLRDSPYDPAEVIPLSVEVRRLFHSYFEQLVRRAGQAVPRYQLPTDAEDLSYVIAAVMQQTALTERQRLLELTDTRLRLLAEQTLLAVEIGRMSDLSGNALEEIVPLTAEAFRSITSRN